MLEAIGSSFNIHPIFPNNAVVMRIGTLHKPTPSPCSVSSEMIKPIVKAANVLGQDSSTEIIDVSALLGNSGPMIKYAGVADAAGRLYCVDRQISTSCWLKIVTIANDCQSSNALLMTTDNGVVLKTIRSITPGEPLLMWFTEKILAMLNMPYLTSLNFKENRYVCHVCKNHFEYPNPLKIHLALKCNSLDKSHLWTQLAKECMQESKPSPPIAPNYLQNLMSFNFNLTGLSDLPPMMPIPRSSPVSMSSPFKTTIPAFPIHHSRANSSGNSSYSSTSSNETSPTSLTKVSCTMPSPMGYYMRPPTVSSVVKPSPVRSSAQSQFSFKPYMLNDPPKSPQNERPQIIQPPVRSPLVFPPAERSPVILPPPEASPLMHYQARIDNISKLQVQTDADAATLETIASNLGKSTNGHLCIYCGKIYSRKYGLKIHIRTHTGYKPLKCKHCDRPFGDPSNLNKHARLHCEGDTPYKCDFCGKILVRRRDLERHIKSRHIQQGSNQATSQAAIEGPNQITSKVK